MKLYIKYMVSNRSIKTVKAELDALGINYEKVDIGEIDVNKILTPHKLLQLRNALTRNSFELISGKKAILIEKIKLVIEEMVRAEGEYPKSNFSDYITQRLHYDYTYMANLFKVMTGITIEYFVIAHKIERVKELLIYDELNLSEISYKLNYSSVAHLSSQFKKVTGLTPGFYRQIKKIRKMSTVKV